MSERAQIPRVTDILAGGVEALLSARPHAVQFLPNGRYGDVFCLWRAQIKLALARLADECAACRVPLAEGQSLRDLLASEFDAVTDPEPQSAIGTIQLYRHNTTGATLQGGLIRKGTRFSRAAVPGTTPPVRAAQYETVEPVFVGSLTPTLSVTIPLRVIATQPGTAANIQPQDPVVAIADQLFDSHFAVQSSEAAGGSDGVSIPKLRSLAQAISLGQYGPTRTALLAGALLTQGVSRVASCEYDDPGYPQYRGGTALWIADDSWCWSKQLADTCLQNLRDSWLGFGCKAWINEVANVPVSLSASVLLRDKRFVADTVEIADNIRAACIAYLNDRPDWWIWRERSIACRMVSCDRRVLAVPVSPGVVLTDLRFNTPLLESTRLPSMPADDLHHYELDDANVQLTFLTPGAAY